MTIVDSAHMARSRIPPKPIWTPTYLAAWRGYAKLRHEDVAPFIRGKGGKSPAQLSKIERGLAEYRQAVLEGYAEACGCTPADLLTRPPERAPATSIDRVMVILEALREGLSDAEILRILRGVLP